ncbi:MAG: hypothetical protein K6G01_04790 [Eubacterium sp.]|nr:hypothetical protein [Eubacterium sp.]
MRKNKKLIALCGVVMAFAMIFTTAATPTMAATSPRVTSSKSYYDYGNGWTLGATDNTTYSKSGVLQKTSYVAYDDGKKSYSSKTKYTYYKKGKFKGYTKTAVSTQKHDGTTTKTTSKYKYKKKGKTLTTTCKNYKGKKLSSKEVIKETFYDKSFTKIKQYDSKTYDSSNSLTSRYLYNYNKKGHTKNYKVWSSGSLQVKGSYSYNKKGKAVKGSYTTYNDGGQTVHNVKYAYKNGYTIETVTNSDGTKDSKMKYKLDAAENIVYDYTTNWSYTTDENGQTVTSKTTYKYKNTFYKKGAGKGCLKKSIMSIDGSPFYKVIYKYKKF